jgi:hypothetical protein
VNAGTWVAIAAAVIAAAAAWYGRRQAVAAKAQAKAAKDQVAIMQQQLDNEEADRHKARGPDFETNSSIGIIEAGQPAAGIVVKQVGGPGHSEVTVTVQRNDKVLGLIGDNGGGIVDAIRWTDNAPGKVNILVVGLKGVAPVNLVLDFKSVEAGNDKPWTCTKTIIPEIPFAIRQFGPRWASRVAEDSFDN